MKSLVVQLALMFAERKARQDLRPLIALLIALGLTIALFSVCFHVIMGQVEGREYSWASSVYWTLTVMSTLGFGDITFHSDIGRAFSVVVLLTGLVLLLVVMPFAFIRSFYAPWLEARIRLRAPREAPEDVTGHVIFCHYDPVVGALAERLRSLGIPHYVIEQDPATAGNLHVDGVSAVTGDVDARKTYAALRAEHALLVVANLDDATNSNITLTVREQAPQVAVAAIAEEEDAVDVLQLAGANYVLPLKQKLGEHLASRVNAGPVQAHVVGRFKDLLIAEFPVHNTSLAGRAIRDTRLRQLTGLSIVAYWERGHLLPARADSVLGDYSVAVVVGTEDQVTELNAMFVIYAPNENPVVVIGGGKVGQATARALRGREVAVHLVEKDAGQRAQLARVADRVIIGNAADRDVLMDAGLARAPSVVLTTNDDAINIFLSIYCRRLNPDLRIVSRITHERNLEAIHRAGADFVLSYNALAVKSLMALLLHREVVVLGDGADLFMLRVPESIADKTLAESGIGAHTGLNVIAVQFGEEVVTNPPATCRLRAGGEIVVIGTSEQRQTFIERFGGAASRHSRRKGA
ncbi:MAG TPA: NAD-binding protein [Polyangiaceae bacterium]